LLKISLHFNVNSFLNKIFFGKENPLLSIEVTYHSLLKNN
jgi:hypothetical protein